MIEKKEVQQRIVEKEEITEKASEEELFQVLRMLAPGTNIRTGLNGIMKGGKGALIVVETPDVPQMVDGGFRLNSRFSSQKLMELSKMDGGIILSKDMKRIITANALLTPSSRIPTSETGTRHKAGERVAKQAGTLVIAISERRNEITVFYKNLKYPLADSGELLRRANEHVQLLEKQRELFDKSIQKLNFLEMRNYPSIDMAINVIQKAGIIDRISTGLKAQIIELGKEGTLIKTRLRELISDVERESDLVIKDYSSVGFKKSKEVISELSYDDLLIKEAIVKALGHENGVNANYTVEGWRILSKTTLTEPEIAAIIKQSETLGIAIHSRRDFYEGIIGPERATIFKTDIDNIKLNS